ncbi:translesion DNA synthesis-associated protein ImuA [Acidovorax sp. NCPPB 4044]|uniref:translesion DNA synthesis-associated protein ImuA n=1 Tax=Acidovorax sp. NCPPB 4044 TaxID=2940490 RepID=UPI0023026785|nr:translesion DNA synthesis-associated protein ImuA [Acidovorax sp. NCPPB 4044]MDA8521183.1 translesion DNA synthesis-associated protein ImuA [Acidovorax sp. NCPPB 4044]
MAALHSHALSSAPPARALSLAARAAGVEVPGVWRGASLGGGLGGQGGAPARVQPSGHAALDAQLPGGGWPQGALSEVLLPDRGRHEWPLVLPALAGLAARRAGQVVLVAPPHEPFVPVLHAAGLRAGRLCWVAPPADARNAAAAWACEQALRCRDVLAVLAWLPRAQPEMLRRLQLAAAQRGALLWVFRAEAQRQQASPAPLRLWVQPSQEEAATLRVHIVKRRGAPLLEPVALPAHGAALESALAAARSAKERRLAAWAAWRAAPRRPGTRGRAGALAAAFLSSSAPGVAPETRDALGRAAVAAR